MRPPDAASNGSTGSSVRPVHGLDNSFLSTLFLQ
jgi:hypothetical protein